MATRERSWWRRGGPRSRPCLGEGSKPKSAPLRHEGVAPRWFARWGRPRGGPSRRRGSDDGAEARVDEGGGAEVSVGGLRWRHEAGVGRVAEGSVLEGARVGGEANEVVRLRRWRCAGEAGGAEGFRARGGPKVGVPCGGGGESSEAAPRWCEAEVAPHWCEAEAAHRCGHSPKGGGAGEGWSKPDAGQPEGARARRDPGKH